MRKRAKIKRGNTQVPPILNWSIGKTNLWWKKSVLGSGRVLTVKVQKKTLGAGNAGHADLGSVAEVYTYVKIHWATY